MSLPNSEGVNPQFENFGNGKQHKKHHKDGRGIINEHHQFVCDVDVTRIVIYGFNHARYGIVQTNRAKPKV